MSWGPRVIGRTPGQTHGSHFVTTWQICFCPPRQLLTRLVTADNEVRGACASSRLALSSLHGGRRHVNKHSGNTNKGLVLSVHAAHHCRCSPPVLASRGYTHGGGTRRDVMDRGRARAGGVLSRGRWLAAYTCSMLCCVRGRAGRGGAGRGGLVPAASFWSAPGKLP